MHCRLAGAIRNSRSSCLNTMLQESIEAFIIYNCEKFKNIDEYSSEQYTTWRV